MTQDLLRVRDLEPPMGDLFTHATWAANRGIWTRPADGEAGQPARRIIHARVLRWPGRVRLDRLGLRAGAGYHKCGSRQDPDWVSALRVRVLRGGRWTELLRRTRLPRPRAGEMRWFALGETVTEGVSLEVRRSGIDDGWTPWNLAEAAFVLEGEPLDPPPPRAERTLAVGAVSLAGLPRGVEARHGDGEVRYRTKEFEVGFHLGRPGFSFLGLHGEEPALAGVNTLAVQPAFNLQGPGLHEAGRAPVLAPTVRFDARGTAAVRGGRVEYVFTAGPATYRLQWRVGPGGLRLRAERTAERAVLAWQSAVWTIGLRNSVAPSHAIGALHRDGEVGALALPMLLHVPRFGTWEIATGAGDGAWARSDCDRARDHNLLELKMGERRTPEGLYRIERGRATADFTLRPRRAPAVLRAEAPAAVRRAAARTYFTAMTYRADTGTLSNNGASMHCPICLDTWAAVLLPLGEVRRGWRPAELVRTSLERWLDGGPGYAAGKLLAGGKAHDAADEYLMTDAAGLRGLADYLRHEATPAWWGRYRGRIRDRIAAVRRRDLDGDGLIESPYRTGVSGTGQWSTGWFDVISFGWKDALANAVLHGALVQLAPALQRQGDVRGGRDAEQWAARLRASFHPTFWNETTGWYAGWRCKEGKLHDHAFLAVNGAAVALGLTDRDGGRAVMERLLAEARRVGMPDAALGLPGNLRPIPDEDLADIQQGYPMGYYQNGGRTHAQARHTVAALYRVGLDAEADRLLERLCVGMAEARVFGGNRSGVDWRHWDDRPCGYEGLLTDQFGYLEAVWARWMKRVRRRRRAGAQRGSPAARKATRASSCASE